MPCLDCGCPGIKGRCAGCQRSAWRARDVERASAFERGYDREHRRLRAQVQDAIEAGEITGCVTCHRPLDPKRWDLGHDSVDRNVYLGPQCWPCNRGHRAARH